MIYFLLSAVVAGVVLFILYTRKERGAGPLRGKCLREFKMPRREAEKSLERHIEALRKKFPGRKEEWYLEKILYDLERDRR